MLGTRPLWSWKQLWLGTRGPSLGPKTATRWKRLWKFKGLPLYKYPWAQNDSAAAKSQATKKSILDSATELEMNMILNKTLNRTTSSATLKCTLLDSKGDVAEVNKDYKRTDLVAKQGLLPRDLRKLDVSTHNIVPAILVRENSILVNLLHHRALIKADSVLLFDGVGTPSPMSTSSGIDPLQQQSLFLYDLEHKLKTPSNAPYEQKALEAILVSVVTQLDAEFKVHELMVGGILNDLERKLSREQLRFLLVQSKQLSAFLQKATLIRNALEDLISSDPDMCDLYLTAKKNGHPLSESDDHSDVEVMLESYYGQCDEIVQNAENLVTNIKSTEEIINILLDSNRNSLMLLELRFQIGMLALTCGSAIAGLYGMNLKNFIEDSQWGFVAVSTMATVISMAALVMSLRRLEQVRRLHISERPKGSMKEPPEY